MTRIPQQMIPLIIIFAAVIGGLFVLRAILLPDTFGEYGHYRAAAADEIRDLPFSYASYQACLDCHDDIQAMKANSNHSSVACEACHGAAAQHVEAPDEFIPNAPRGRDYCVLCHGYNQARPTGFPQIIPIVHNPGQPCMSCHNPHQPLLPHAPSECSACHREIANQKAVSPHTTLDCTQCHTVPEEHLTSPQAAAALKPTSKEVCGNCHARDAESPRRIPRIDLETHGNRYLCWDCHYPHFPEAAL